MIHIAYGLGICSELELPELSAAPAGVEVDVRVCSRSPDPIVPPEGGSEGEIQPVVSARDGELIVAFGDTATFAVSNGAEGLTCEVYGADDAPTRHLLLDQLLPRLIAADALAVLHASAALVDDGVLAFAAPSRGGKSTLVAMLGRLGMPIVSDDALVVRATADGPCAVPSYPGLRLAPEMIATLDADLVTLPLGDGAAKHRVLPGATLTFAADPAPLRGVAVLERTSGAPHASRLHGAATVDALLRAAFPPLEHSGDARLFDRAATLADSIPVLRLEASNDASGREVLDAALEACA